MSNFNEERVRNLPTRERDTLILIARGHTHAEVAEMLGVSESAVKRWTENLRMKLGVERTAEIPYAYFRATGESPTTMELSGGG